MLTRLGGVWEGPSVSLDMSLGSKLPSAVGMTVQALALALRGRCVGVGIGAVWALDRRCVGAAWALDRRCMGAAWAFARHAQGVGWAIVGHSMGAC